jgi:hypothetical protein
MATPNWPGEAADRGSSYRGLVVLHRVNGFYDGKIIAVSQAEPGRRCLVALRRRSGRSDRAVRGYRRPGLGGAHGQLRLAQSVECEGFALDDGLHASHPGWEKLTDRQVEAIARLFLRGHQERGYPLQLATSPTGRGLGHHSMGAENGYDWGHSHCPGEPIKAQKPAILARALQLAGQSSMTGDEMLDLEQKIPGTVYGPSDKERSLGLLLLDLHQALNPYQAEWQNESLRNTRALLAGQAADEKRDAVMLATLQALTVGGTSVDTAAVLARINEVAAAESTTVAALAAQVAELQHKLAAAAAAEAGALAQ